MQSALLLVPVLVVAAALWWVAHRRVARRLALRNARRRPAESALVVAGSLLGAALITGSLIVGDTLDSSIRVSARTQLGPVDETITVAEPGRARDLAARIESLDAPIDGVISFLQVSATVADGTGSDARAEPDARLVELAFDSGRKFGSDVAATGLSGNTPSSGEVAVTEDLAATLGATVGDEVEVYLYGTRRSLEIVRVLPRLGLAGFWTGFESTSSNAFVAPGTVADALGSELPKGAVPPTTTVAVSNRGDVEGGALLTERVIEAIEGELGGDALRVEPVKRDLLVQAEEQGQQFSELFLSIGSFAVLAGILLLVNIFVMLAEERKSQLGMLRAVGMTRADLVRSFILEGTLYALVASALGAGAGIGVGWAIVKLAAPIFSGGGDLSLDLSFSLSRESLISGFLIGFLISTVTVIGTSARIAHINIIRAIRDLPDPARSAPRLATLVGGGLLALAAASLFVTLLGERDAWAIAIMGPPLVAFGLLPTGSRLMGRRTAVLVAAASSLVWGIFGNTITGGQFFDSGELVAFVFQGVLLTFSAVILLSQSQESLEGGIRLVAARSLPLRLGLAYPLARRFRTGLTLGMYALVIFTMTFIAVLTNVFTGQIDRATRDEAGGFELLVTASEANPPAGRALERAEGIARASAQVHGTALWQPRSFSEPAPWPVTGVEKSFVRIGPPAIEERAPGFAGDAAVWRRLVADPTTVVVDSFFLQAGGGPPASSVQPGETIEVIDPVTGAGVDRRVIGVTDSGQAFSGAFMARRSVSEVFSGRVAANRFYVVTEPSADLDAVAAGLQGRFVDNGVEARSFRSIIEESQRLNLQFLQLMQGYLALGLLVGIAGLGVVMVRAVRERRHEIGVLRALGFLAPMVRRSFLLESGFTALEGILVGSSLALVTAAQLVANGDFGEGLEFVIPWPAVGLLCAISLMASLLATLWPAQQASRIPPAVALRVAE
ncbi:MAG: ABC transporter permease [Actinomycetota bacterium]|nr:FtsX-like permease family protein [Actinomycetota bacterium]